MPQLMGGMMPMAAGGAAPAAAATPEAAPEEESAPAKEFFDLKLVGFDASSKIKVIKEVRALSGLGLKEVSTCVQCTERPAASHCADDCLTLLCRRKNWLKACRRS
jgi:ribosomal protein L7/L12